MSQILLPYGMYYLKIIGINEYLFAIFAYYGNVQMMEVVWRIFEQKMKNTWTAIIQENSAGVLIQSTVKRAIIRAAERGHIHCLKYIFETCGDILQNCEGTTFGASICENAAMSGNLDCLQYLHQKGFELRPQVFRELANHGNLSMF